MDETHRLLVSLAGILVLGTAAQWLAWRLRLPSILLLLVVGFVFGPVTGLLRPDELLGEVLFPLVSLSVALILFEGGLTLRLAELRQAGGTLARLLTIGALTCWLLAAIGARGLLGMSWSTALLLGAVLVVTGPTVIGPLLRDIRPVGPVSLIAKWEGIVIDPIGAVLALLVFEATKTVGTVSLSDALLDGGHEMLRTVLIGGLAGTGAAVLLVALLWRYAIPDPLQNPVTLTLVLAVFVVANLLQEESGLLAVTLMGLILANQPWVSVKHIMEFKENLRVLLISSLFILLAARLRLDELSSLGWQTAAFVAFLMVVVRPASVWLSTLGSGLNWRERLFLSWFAPRGIVAAAVSSVFALQLGTAAEGLAQTTFVVIAATVTIYGLTAGPLARRLGLATADPQGVLIVGAHTAGRAIGKTLQTAGFPVMMVDSGLANVQAARMEGLPAYFGSILSEHAIDELDLGGIGRLLALTSNDEVNSLAALHFSDIFGRVNVYQLAPEDEQRPRTKTASHLVRGRILFEPSMTFEELNRQFAAGALIKRTKLTAEFNYDAFRAERGSDALPLFIVTDTGKLIVCTPEKSIAPKPGHALVSLMPAKDLSNTETSAKSAKGTGM